MLPKEQKIKTLISQKGLDGAIISSPENFHYVTGFTGHQHTVSRQPGFSLAVMSAKKDMPTQLTTMDFEIPTFEANNKCGFIIRKYDTWVGVKTWGEIANNEPVAESGIFESSIDILGKMMDEMGLMDKKVGVELDYLTYNYYKMLCEKFPKVQFVNISDLFVWSHSVKEPDEIKMFRTLCAAADNAFYEVSKIVRIGISEKELAACFRQHALASGVCLPSSWSMFSTGAFGARLGLPTDRIIADGDVVKFDAGVNAEFDFYTTDTSRAWIIGNADPVLQKLKDRLYEGQRRMIALAKPGVPINELFRTAFEYVREAYPRYRRGHTGHSISMGPATAEAPYINALTDRPLEAGMVLAMEVPCYIRDCNGFNIEDMVLITEDGCEILTPKTPHYL